MSIAGVTDPAVAAMTATATPEWEDPNPLGKKEFLMLLVAQLRNQDPLRPMEDREFISQLAQLNTLEQLERMNETMATMAEMSMLAQAGNLIGLEVTALVPGSSETFTGIVSAVTLLEGVPYLTVGDVLIKSTDILSLNWPTPGTAPEPGDDDATDPIDADDNGTGPVDGAADADTNELISDSGDAASGDQAESSA